jgi:protein involved in polysaccharide export with SLBB domain
MLWRSGGLNLGCRILLTLAILVSQVSAAQIHPDPGKKVESIRQFTIAGEVRRPGIYPMKTSLRIFDALALVGGFLYPDTAHLTKIVVVRGGRQIKFDWSKFCAGTGLEQNIFLEDLDEIRVTRSKTSK